MVPGVMFLPIPRLYPLLGPSSPQWEASRGAVIPVWEVPRVSVPGAWPGELR